MCFFFSFVVSGVNQFKTVYPKSYANSQQTHMKNSAQFHNKKKKIQAKQTESPTGFWRKFEKKQKELSC